MPRVVPSQVAEFIDDITSIEVAMGVTRVNSIGSARLRGVLDLVDQVPDELLVMDGAMYASFIAAKADIEDLLEVWNAERINGRMHEVRWNSGMNPLVIIRDALAQCPDESPAPSTSELSFISDPELKANLRDDIGRVETALSNGEWKAATVLAGSVIEALLLWKLQQRPSADVMAAVSALPTVGKADASNLERWDLHQFTEVAAHLGIIKPDTATETRLAREFRNLIHPGRAQRLAKKCDRGTALSCVAALEHVVRDLS